MTPVTTKTKKSAKEVAKLPTSNGMEATIFNAQGKKAGTLTLPETIFGLPWNGDLVHQVVTSMQANARLPWAHTKQRGEVRGGGKKPWRQKGTGRARHGSTRSPIWVGGGIAHGPRNERSYEKKIGRSMRRKALLVALSRKWKDGEIIFVDSLGIESPKTAQAKVILSSLSAGGLNLKKNNAALVVTPTINQPVAKSFSNFGNVEASPVQNLNPVSVLGAKYLIISEPEAVMQFLNIKKN